eukprot:UC4_evm1s1489
MQPVPTSNISCKHQTSVVSLPLAGHASMKSFYFSLSNHFTSMVSALLIIFGTLNCLNFVGARTTNSPTVLCPDDILAHPTSLGSSSAIVDYPDSTAIAGDGVTPLDTFTLTPANSSFELGSTSVYIYTKDPETGRTAACSFTITVVDQEPPIFSSPCPQPQLLLSSDPGTNTKSYTIPEMPLATDNVNVTTINASHTSGDVVMLPLGTTHFTYLVSDAAGNTANCSFSVTVVDSEPPEIQCPSNEAIDATEAAGKAYIFDISSTDNDAAAVTDTSVMSGTILAIGSHVINATATDNSGNTAFCQWSVNVIDRVVPNITCPPDMDVPMDHGAKTVSSFTYPEATGTDNMGNDGITFAYLYQSGTVRVPPFSAGINTLSAYAKDANSNIAACTFAVNIVDKEAPRIPECPANVTINAEPGKTTSQHTISTVVPPTDNVEVTNTTFMPLAANNSHFFSLGQNFVSFIASDAAGNTANCSFSVTVVDSEPPEIQCPSNEAIDATEARDKLSQIKAASVKTKFGRGVHVTRQISHSEENKTLAWNENFKMYIEDITNNITFTILDENNEVLVIEQDILDIIDYHKLIHIQPEEFCDVALILPADSKELQLCLTVSAKFNHEWTIRKLRAIGKERGHDTKDLNSDEKEALALLNRGLQHGGNYNILPKQFQAGLINNVFEVPPEPSVGLMHVRLKRAANLIRTDDFPFTADPYLVFTLGNETWKSRMFTNDLNPTWNETFYLSVVDLSDDLEFQVMDFNENDPHVFMGSGKVSIDRLEHNQEYGVDLPLHGVDHGEVFLDIMLRITSEDILHMHERKLRRDRSSVANLIVVAHTAPPGYIKPPQFSGLDDESAPTYNSPPAFEDLEHEKRAEAILYVTLESGADLVAMDEFPYSSDPYVIFELGAHGHAYKTSVIKNNLNPEWNESFELVISDLTEDLNIYAMDEDVIKAPGQGDDSLGNATYSLWRLAHGEERVELITLDGVSSGSLKLKMRLDPLNEDAKKKLSELCKRAEVKSQNRDRNVMWSATALPGYFDPPSFDSEEDADLMSQLRGNRNRNTSVVLNGLSPDNTTAVDTVMELEHFSPSGAEGTNLDPTTFHSLGTHLYNDESTHAPNPAYDQDFGTMVLSDFSPVRGEASNIYADFVGDLEAFDDDDSNIPNNSTPFQENSAGAYVYSGAPDTKPGADNISYGFKTSGDSEGNIYDGTGTLKSGFRVNDMSQGFKTSEEDKYENENVPREGFVIEDEDINNKAVTFKNDQSVNVQDNDVIRMASRKTTMPDGTVTEETVTVRKDPVVIRQPALSEGGKSRSHWNSISTKAKTIGRVSTMTSAQVWGSLDLDFDDDSEVSSEEGYQNMGNEILM